MRFRLAISAVLVAACSLVATTALVTTGSAAPPLTANSGKPPKPPKPTPTPTATPKPTPTPPPVNPADADFVSMMIPHHYQALLMSQMAPTRTNDQAVRSIASQIDVEQGLEITTMQSWQSWNGLEVTDAEKAYQEHLQDPMMLEMMGMATPEQMAALSAANGAAFEVMYLRLMIRHHQGALDMLADVLVHGSDETLRGWANDMYVTQQAQINWMQNLLASKTS
ncbi:DUF305 domain-containing protein [Micromonospora sp. SL1-18]|uniref:DUF305 domain-containing protein n=1 Tax=Micromonospora sp. SL1-18 TaxID=3399128 RepID=UPI003A4E4B0B